MCERSIRISFDVELPRDQVDVADKLVADWIRSRTNDLTDEIAGNTLRDVELRPVFGTMRIHRGDREIY